MNDAKKELDRILKDAKSRDDMRPILEDIIPMMVDIYEDNMGRFNPEDSRRKGDLAMSASVSIAATLFIHALHTIRPDHPDDVASFMESWVNATADGMMQSLEDFTKHHTPGGYH